MRSRQHNGTFYSLLIHKYIYFIFTLHTHKHTHTHLNIGYQHMRTCYITCRMCRRFYGSKIINQYSNFLHHQFIKQNFQLDFVHGLPCIGSMQRGNIGEKQHFEFFSKFKKTHYLFLFLNISNQQQNITPYKLFNNNCLNISLNQKYYDYNTSFSVIASVQKFYRAYVKYK